MEKEQGLQIIEQALDLANSKGAFKLGEAATIFTALNTVKVVFEKYKENIELINTISDLENEKIINLNTIDRLKESVLELSKNPQIINNTTILKPKTK